MVVFGRPEIIAIVRLMALIVVVKAQPRYGRRENVDEGERDTRKCELRFIPPMWSCFLHQWKRIRERQYDQAGCRYRNDPAVVHQRVRSYAGRGENRRFVKASEFRPGGSCSIRDLKDQISE